MSSVTAARDELVDNDGCSEAYISASIGDDLLHPERIRSKRNYLFSLIPQADLWKIQVDDLALYSITEYRLAASMTENIFKALEISWGGGDLGKSRARQSTITDACACVGGNSLSFATAFRAVHAVEISAQRCKMLANNSRVSGASVVLGTGFGEGKPCGVVDLSHVIPTTPGLSSSTITVHCADYTQELASSLQQDVVFFDPPWGGAGYKKAAALDMYLGEVDVGDLACTLTGSGGVPARARLVAIKAPLNYNVEGLKKKLEAGSAGATVSICPPYHNMQLILVHASKTSLEKQLLTVTAGSGNDGLGISSSRDMEGERGEGTEHGLPPNWKSAISSKSGKTYWYNTVTNESSYIFPSSASAPIPPSFPPNWVLATSSKTGKTYYYNTLTKESRYDEPTVNPIHSADAAAMTLTANANKRARSSLLNCDPITSASSTTTTFAATQPSASLALSVGTAYNAIVEQDRSARDSSPILHFRAFQNFIKASLIRTYAPQPARRVLDLCCGQLGDMPKWRAAGVAFYCGVDIAKVRLETAVRRFQGSSAPALKLVCADVGALDLGAAGVLAPGEVFECISCQFALHYMFETESRALALFSNISGRLAPGGVFLGTIPDAGVLIRRLRDKLGGERQKPEIHHDNSSVSFGNSIFKVVFPRKSADAQWSLGNNPYGVRYDFWLSERVESDANSEGDGGGVPEYLVPWPLLERLAKCVGLEPVAKENFHDFFRKVCGEGGPSPSDVSLLKKMKVFDCEGTLSKDEWETAGLYRVFAFKKV